MIGARPFVATIPVVDGRGHMTANFRRVLQQIWTFSGIEDVANSLRMVDPQSLPSSVAELYVANQAAVRVDKLTLTNTDSLAHTITIYYVPQGQAASAGNTQLSAYSMPANTSEEMTNLEGHVLNKGDSIQAFADTAGVVSIMASGVILPRPQT